MFWKKMKNWIANWVGGNRSDESGNQSSASGEEVEVDWPALAFAYPTPYFQLDEIQKKRMVDLSSDFCEITYPDRTDRFIRVVLKQKVKDFPKSLDYGLWVSLSEESFTDYADNFDNQNHEKEYFGWLSNDIPEYGITMNLPMTVVTKLGNDRPEIFPQQNFEHPFIKDFYEGISRAEAERRVNMIFK